MLTELIHWARVAVLSLSLSQVDGKRRQGSLGGFSAKGSRDIGPDREEMEGSTEMVILGKYLTNTSFPNSVE